MTYSEALDEALCWGWIDGVRRRIDEDRWMIRFLPRKPGSVWSVVNVRRAEAQVAAGQMTPAGRRVFAARDPAKSKHFSTEHHQAAFSPELQARLEADAGARAFFAAQAPSYQRAATYWVMSAKREETRARRMAELLERSARGLKPGVLTPATGGKRGAGGR